MKNLILLKILQQFDLKSAAAKFNGSQWLRSPWAKSLRVAPASPQASPSKSNAGFTVIELVFVVLIVGILSAIAAPGWFAFTNRQRVNKANDAVWGALQQAQREAKRTKLSYSVSFIQNPVPQFVIYPANQTGSCTSAPIPALSDPRWTNLGDNTLKPGQVWLYTNIANNIANTCSTSNQVDTSGTSLTATAKTITFDYTGALPPTSKTGLKVVVAQAKPGTSPPLTLDSSILRRCVIVQTLIGGIQTSTDPNVCN